MNTLLRHQSDFSYLFIILALFIGCNQVGVFEPNPAPVFTWKQYLIDYDICESLRYDFIWASSSDDVYLVGEITCADYDLIHFDGRSWENVPLRAPYTSYFDVQNIFGFDQNNIWICGDAGAEGTRVDMLGHYDGSGWTRIPPPYIVREHSTLYSIYGDRPDNIWAGGNYGTLYHYDGYIWKRDTLIFPNPPKAEDAVQYGIQSIIGNEIHGYYLKTHGWTSDVGSIAYLFRYEQNQWACIDSGDYAGILYMSPEGTLYITGSNLRKWNGKNWTDLNLDYLVNGIHVESDHQIFATLNATSGSTIAYFNGKEWIEYDELRTTKIYYFDVLYIDGELFVLGQRWEGKNIGVVWQGKPVL